MAKSKPRLYIRKFLNKPGHHTVASVLVSISKNGSITFILSDCDRTLNLDFSAYRPDAKRNSIYKANLLIDVLTQFRNAMEAQFASDSDRGDDD